MKLPNLARAVVPAPKITEYLLSDTHADGKHKARFFKAFGYSMENWQELEESVRQHAGDHEVAGVEQSPFGTRYIVEGIMEAPDGRLPWIRAVWFIRNEEENPQFVTGYPMRRRADD